MFGTLVICLPSAHTGGEVHLVHGSQRHRLETAPASKFDVTTLAWYSDVQHEIKPITSGHRLVLTYNLVQSRNEPTQSAAALDQSHAQLERLLRIWNEVHPEQDAYIYPLAHQYTQANLSMKGLKGEDAAKAKYLQQLCSKNGFFWFLGTMTKETEDDEYAEEASGATWDCIVTPGGEEVGLSVDIDQDIILAEDLYAGRDADSEVEGEFTGNEGMAMTYRYHNTVCILMRKSRIIDHIPTHGSENEKMRGLFHLLRDDLASRTDEGQLEICKTGMLRILTCIVGKIPLNETTSYYRTYGYLSECREDLQELFAEVCDFCNDHGIADIVRKALGTILTTAVISSAREIVPMILKQIVQDSGANAKEAWDQMFPPWSKSPTFDDLLKVKTNMGVIKTALPATLLPAFEEWTCQKLEALTGSITQLEEKDVSSFLSLLPSLDHEQFFQNILPTIMNQQSRSLLVQFLSKLATAEVERTSKWETLVKRTYSTAIQPALSMLAISQADLMERQSHPTFYRSLPDEYTSTGGRSAHITHFFAVFNRVLELGMEKEARSLVEAGLPHLDTAEWDLWENVVNLVEKLINVLLTYDIQTVNAAAAPWIKSTLLRLTSILANRKPLNPTNWTRSPFISCTCEPCRSLKHFLADPNQEVGRFTHVLHIRQHLQRHLSSAYYKFDTDRRGSPQTLVIHKTNNEYRQKIQQWNSDLDRYRNRVSMIRSSFTDSMQGEDITTYTYINNSSLPSPNLQSFPEAQPSNGHLSASSNPHSRNYQQSAPPQRAHQAPVRPQLPLPVSSKNRTLPWTQGPGGPAFTAFREPSFSWNDQSLRPVPAAAMNARDVPPVAGVKRKADVVDLTGDASD